MYRPARPAAESGAEIKKKWILAIPALAIVAGCGTATATQAPAAQPTAPAATTPASVRADLATVLSDLRQADTDHREAWIADGYSNDIQTLADEADTAGHTSFGVDWETYMNAAGGDTDPHLPSGWKSAYAQIRDDLNQWAAEVGLKPVPAPSWPISGTPAPDTTEPPADVTSPPATDPAAPAPSASAPAGSGSCHARDNGQLPDPNCTPGATDPRVTQDNIQSTICRTGYTATVRPPESVTEKFKYDVAWPEYGIPASVHGELDHLRVIQNSL